jgi:hypothetical protein
MQTGEPIQEDVFFALGDGLVYIREEMLAKVLHQEGYSVVIHGVCSVGTSKHVPDAGKFRRVKQDRLPACPVSRSIRCPVLRRSRPFQHQADALAVTSTHEPALVNGAGVSGCPQGFAPHALHGSKERLERLRF